MSKIQSKSKKQVELEEDSSSEEEVVTKKQVKTAQPAAKKAPAKKVVESESSDEEEIIKPAPKGKAAAKADTKTATKAKKVESDSEESELEDIAPKGKKAAAAPAKKAVAKKVESSDEESEEEVKPAAKKAPAKKPAKVESSDEESEEEVKPAAKKAPAKKPAKEESEEEESEEEVKPAAKTQAAPAQNGPADDGNYEVFIKGLPFAAAEHDIREYFQEAGEIASVNLLKGPDGRSKGIAFVRYNDNNGLTTALSYSNGDFGGRQILVEKTTPKGQRNDGAQGGRGGFGGAQGGRGGFGGAAGNPAEFGPKSERDPNSCSIFVGNLSWGTDEHSLSAFFESCGAVQNVRIARDPEGKARGFGHVDFAAPDAVEQAVAKAGQNLDGRPVRVDYATSKKQDGGRGGFGGGARGGFGGAPGGQRMNLGFEDAAKKKGSISSFQGQKQRL